MVAGNWICGIAFTRDEVLALFEDVLDLIPPADPFRDLLARCRAWDDLATLHVGGAAFVATVLSLQSAPGVDVMTMARLAAKEIGGFPAPELGMVFDRLLREAALNPGSGLRDGLRTESVLDHLVEERVDSWVKAFAAAPVKATVKAEVAARR